MNPEAGAVRSTALTAKLAIKNAPGNTSNLPGPG